MSHRRRSVVDQTSLLVSTVKERQDQLKDIWDDVGFTEEERECRVEALYKHLNRMLDDMVREEVSMRNELQLDIENSSAEYENLCGQLGVPFSEVDESGGLMKVARRFKNIITELGEEKDRRLSRLAVLKEQDEIFATQLVVAHYRMPLDVVPTEDQMDAMERHISSNETLVLRRKEKVSAARARTRVIEAVMGPYEVLPEPAFIEQLLSREPDAFPLSSANVHSLDVYLEKLETNFSDFKERMNQLYFEKRRELESWYDRCLVPGAQRHLLHEEMKDLYAPEDVEALDKELSRWQRYYAAREAVLRKAEEWDGLWAEKVAYERRETDGKDRYNNRGGNLEKELKRQRILENRDLPRCESDLSRMVTEWRAGHPGEALSFGHGDPLEHVRRTKEDYVEEKARAKADKENFRRRELHEASVFGTPGRAANPMKRGAGGAQPFARAANAAHSGIARTPVKTAHGLLLAVGASPLASSRSVSRLASPGRGTPSKLRKVETTTQLHAPRAGFGFGAPTALIHTTIRKAGPGLDSGLCSTATTAERAQSPEHLEETIDEHAFKSGEFAHSSFVSAQSHQH